MKAHLILLALAVLATACSSQTAIVEQPSSAVTQLEQSVDETPAADTREATVVELPKAAPLKVTNSQPTLWQLLASNYSFSTDQNHSRIQPHLDWLTANQSYINRITQRGERYLHHIVEQIEQRELPYELALLPAVESAYDPRAYSHSQAAGLWQFVPRTGDSFGLKRDWWADQRRDVIASTDAALDYLQYLNKRFDGDWLLALAAYNAGEGTVSRAIKKNKRKGLGTDYWSLPLPRETKGYVPRLLALAEVIQHPGKYQVQLPETLNQPYFTVVELPSPIHLIKAAEMADVKYSTLEQLNPAYKRHVTHPEGPHRLLLPVQQVRHFNKALSTLAASEWTPELQYRVRKGDSLYTLAKKYHLSIKQLKAYNQLSSNTLQIGQRLTIPGTGASVDIPGVTHTVARGESLWSISRKYRVSIADIENWNGLVSNELLKPGQQLKIGSTSHGNSQTSQIKKVTYKVRKGDSLSRIASKFYLSIKQIVEWNQLSRSDYLKPNQRLVLFVDINRI